MNSLRKNKNIGVTWTSLDDTVPGMSLDLAYEKIINKNRPQKVIVAVIDAGIDLDHEDLKSVLWKNKDEIPGNNKDDDNNGYVDDIHGYNFRESYHEQLEFARLSACNWEIRHFRKKLKKLSAEVNETQAMQQQYSEILAVVKEAYAAVVSH